MFRFSFVTDIHAILEVTVFDEDRLKKSEFVGKVSIPLLNIINDEPIWYQLKNQHLTHRVKGEILLEMNIVWNPVSGCPFPACGEVYLNCCFRYELVWLRFFHRRRSMA